MIELRQYQTEAVEAVYGFLRDKPGLNPCVVVPTGGGKTAVMAQICRDVAGRWGGRVLILAHVRELLEQTAGSITAMDPNLMFGIYSAGLGSRDTEHNVIVAGIQSVYRRGRELGKFDLIMVDECHLIPADGDGMYRTLLADLMEINPAIRLVGLTATPYRLSSGWICQPENLLHEICYEISVGDLIDQGYLSKLTAKAGTADARADTSELHIRGGEYVPAESDAMMNTDARIMAAVIDIDKRAGGRKSILIFATSVAHGRAVAECVRAYTGQAVAEVYGDTFDFERDDAIQKFRSGAIRWMVNCQVLTLGFDAPATDCVVLLRPTASPGLYYQMVGRGFRIAPGKPNCLVLDYGENVARHGPVDAVRPKRKGGGEDKPAPQRECPVCATYCPIAAAACPDCGHVFERTERELKHETTAGAANVLSEPEEYRVTDIGYSLHEKRNNDPANPKPPTMRVDYYCGYNHRVSEWVCIEHFGFAGTKAAQWWTRRSECAVPHTVAEAVTLARAGALAPAESILVIREGEYDRIQKWQLGAKPDAETVLERMAIDSESSVADDYSDIPF